ncbi:Amidohydrolase 3 [Granulicella sibirica]|uniref:Amidohydrolase 3 n=1 Tax=Granulicella sibirica TaxID=2479048 RepID=A0A4Q0T3K8_9BACT|nr:Amidohydrolase 3 [Granulicella sibirica]
MLFPALISIPAFSQQRSADTIYMDGMVLTGAHLHPDDPASTPGQVTALAISGGKLVAIGNDVEVLQWKGPNTRVMDLHGAFVMPGFNDAHVHMADAGQQKLSIDLDAVPSLAAMLQVVEKYAATRTAGSWLRGGGWDHTLWPGKQLPTRQALDRVTGGRPCFLWRTDGHMAVANTAALAAAGITAETADPKGAKIDRDAKGEPTGILRETAATNLVLTKIPPPSSEERHKALDVAIVDVLSHGVTSVQDFSEWEDFLVLESMERSGTLKIRFSEWLDFTLPLATLESRRASHPANDPLLHLGMLKGFMDGSLGSRTAAMVEPYADDPGNSGIPRFDQTKLNQMSSERAAAGFQLGFHAIGDRANGIALDALGTSEQVAVAPDTSRSGKPGSDPASSMVVAPSPSTPYAPRFRIEHAQVLLPGDFARFATEHVIASMQPSHLLTDMNWASARLGPKRSAYAYAWKSFLDQGVTLAFGTDYPVESINPFRGLYSAVTRKNEAGTKTFHPEQALTLNQALYAYTQASAYADFAERVRGRLEPGYFADFIVLDRDITAVMPRDLLGTRVLKTVVNGEVVFDATNTGPGR